MGIENFLKTKFKPKAKTEMSQEELENLISVGIISTRSLQELINSFKEIDPLIKEKYLKFIIKGNYDLCLGDMDHFYLKKIAGGDDFFIPDGQVEYNPTTKKISFSYTHKSESPIRYLHVVAENKIRDFLKFQGVEISS